MMIKTAFTLSPEKGFTLIEILISVIILVIITALVTSYVISNQRTSTQSKTFFEATQVAASCLEEAKQKLENPDSLSSILDQVGDSTHHVSFTKTTDIQAFDVTVSYNSVSPNLNLVKIKSIVTWNGSPDTIRLATAFSH